MMKVFRLAKVWAAENLPTITNLFNRNIDFMVTELIQVFLSIIFLNHLMACTWYMQAKFRDFPSDCWIISNQFENDPPEVIYMKAFYWSFQTMSSVGYGDLSPSNYIERLIACTWMILGIGYQGFAIGNIQSLIEARDADRQELSSKIDALRRQRDKN